MTTFLFQVLFVPQHWWHYVESIDPITISINSWIELVLSFLSHCYAGLQFKHMIYQVISLLVNNK